MRVVSARAVERLLGLAAAAILLFMMLYTTYAVASRQFFDAPLLGVIDIMELALVTFIFVAMPGVFLRDENVTVDVVDSVVPAATVTVLRYVAWLIALAFLGISLYAMIPAAMDKYESYEVTMTIGIHKFIHWVPILFGFAGALLATVWVIFKGPVRDPAATDGVDDTGKTTGG